MYMCPRRDMIAVEFLSIPQLSYRDADTYRVSQEERTKLRESVPYVKLYRYNPKHLYPKLNGYGDNGHREKCGHLAFPRNVRLQLCSAVTVRL